MSKSGYRKGFAFVHFGSTESVNYALATKVHMIKNKRVAVRRGMAGADASHATKEMQARKIFASGFTYEVSEEEVFKVLATYGRVERILSPKGGIGQRGFCYIVMKDKAAFDYLCSIGQIPFGEDLISLSAAQLKSEVKESHTKSTGRSQQSESSGSDRFIQNFDSRPEFGSSSRSVPLHQPGPISNNPYQNQRLDRPNSSGQSRAAGWYSPFTGIPRDSFHQFSDRFVTRQPLMPAEWEAKFPRQVGVDVEIVQAISTTVTIRDSQGNTAIRASFDEQNTYTGIF